MDKITKEIIKTGFLPNVSSETINKWAVGIVSDLNAEKERSRTITQKYLSLFIDHIELMDTYIPAWRLFAENEIEQLKQQLLKH